MLNDLLPPGITQKRVMACAMMDFIKHSEDAIFFQQPPKVITLMTHRLICESSTHRTDLPIQTLTKRLRKGCAKTFDDLTGRRKTKYQINLALLKQHARQFCCHSRLASA